jgi:hypothetical protein
MIHEAHQPILSAEDLPREGDPTADEHAVLEFKREQSPSAHAEMAKDIAAFANAFGGTILIGTTREQGAIRHRGITGAVAQELKESYEQVAKDWCRPTPALRPVLIPLRDATSFVVAVNVEAHVAGAVGAYVAANGPGGQSRRLAHARVFPRRAASHTEFLQPEELPMLFDPRTRTIAIKLLRLTPADRKTMRLFVSPPTPVHLPYPGSQRDGGPPRLCECLGELVEVDTETGCARFIVRVFENVPVGDLPAVIPLRDIEDCWRGGIGAWHVRVHGRISDKVPTADAYEPVLR